MTEINPGGTHATWQEAIARGLEGLDPEDRLAGDAIKSDPIPDAGADATSATKWLGAGASPEMFTGEQMIAGLPAVRVFDAGGNNAAARPTGAIVYWINVTAEPTNAQAGDLWFEAD